METVSLGRSGLRVSRLCLGTMLFGSQCDEASSFAIMDEAAELGIDFFDLADVFDAATLGGARALGRDDLGRIAPGSWYSRRCRWRPRSCWRRS